MSPVNLFQNRFTASKPQRQSYQQKERIAPSSIELQIVLHLKSSCGKRLQLLFWEFPPDSVCLAYGCLALRISSRRSAVAAAAPRLACIICKPL